MKKSNEYIEYEDGSRVLLDEDDMPEITAKMMQNAKHGREGLEELLGKEIAYDIENGKKNEDK